jgi:hypothetical protein
MKNFLTFQKKQIGNHGKFIFREGIDLESLQNIRVLDAQDPFEAREEIQQYIEMEIDIMDQMVPNDSLNEALVMTQDDLVLSLAESVDLEAMEEAFGKTKEEIKKEAQEIAEKIKERKDKVQKAIQEKSQALQKELEQKGIDGIIGEEYTKASQSVKESIKEVVVGSLKEDIEKTTLGLQPDSWVEAQAEAIYNKMSAMHMLMYLSYVGAKRTVELPGKIYEGSKEAWNNASTFLEEAYNKAGTTIDDIQQKVNDAFSSDPADAGEEVPITEEEKTFWENLKDLPEKLYTKLANDERLQPIWDYFNHNFRELKDVPDAFRNAEWFDPKNAAPAAFLGAYLSTFFGDSQNPMNGTKNMMITAAIFGTVASVPKVIVPTLDGVTAITKGVARVGGDAFGILWRAGMSFPRDRSAFGVFTNWKYALDGKWHATRQQEYILAGLEQLDTKTRDMVPDEISGVYGKILENDHDNIKSSDVSQAAEFCVKSLDKGVFMNEAEAAEVKDILMKSGGDKWKEINPKKLVRMLNTAYQKRIMVYFLGLPEGNPQKQYFKDQFSEKLAERKIKQAQQAVAGIESADLEKINLEEMYGEKIDFENITEHQRNGIFGDVFQNKNALGSIGMPILMLYLFTTALLSINGYVEKKQQEAAQEKLDKTKDGLSKKKQKKLAKLLEENNDKKAILKFLKKNEILVADEKEMDTLEDLDDITFAKAMDNGNLKSNIGGTLAVLSTNFWTDINTIAGEDVERSEVEEESKKEVQEERLRRAMRGYRTVPRVGVKVENTTGAVDTYEIFDAQQQMGGRLERGWKSFKSKLGLSSKEEKDSFIFKGRYNDQEGQKFAIVQDGDTEYLYFLGGLDENLETIEKVPIHDIEL